MIPRTATSCQIPQPVPDWRRHIAEAVTEPEELFRLLKLPPEMLPAARSAAQCFPLRVPRGFLQLMEKGNPHDPLLRQVLPLARELDEQPGYVDDPLGERHALLGPGVLGKYRGRSLIIASAACAVHCRYCFRRQFPYTENHASRGHWRATLDLLRADSDLEEVILSGGDPLALDDGRLQQLVLELDTMPQVRRLRIHSRLPVVIPQRVTESLVRTLSDTRLKTVVVVHCNHPRELSDAFGEAMARLRPAATLLNQSVLLRDVNDDARSLSDLSRGLFDKGILPYYLHLMDRVRGGAHYSVAEPEALGLMSALRTELPGYLVPKLVREQPGEASKTPVA